MKSASLTSVGLDETIYRQSKYFHLLIIVLIYVMPLASGLRAFSVDVGRAAIGLTDVLLFVAFIVALPTTRLKSLSTIVLIMLTIAVLTASFAFPFPDFGTAYQGVRKSFLWLFAIVIGAHIGSTHKNAVLNAIFISCILICAYAIKQLFYFSEFDNRLLAAQSASEYANMIGGVTRSISVLSSGFHLGMAACVAISFSLYSRKLHYITRIAIFIVAIFAIYASFTRTYMIIAALLIITRYLSTINRAFFTFLIASVTITFLLYLDIDVFKMLLAQALGDDRFANRGESYQMFSYFMSQFPYGQLVGFGPGSAGSTLGDSYQSIGAPWIEPHNIFTKYIFEFGIPLSIFLYVFLTKTIFGEKESHLDFKNGLVYSVLLILVVSGLTITSVEAWPISLYVGFIFGIFFKDPSDGSKSMSVRDNA